MCAEFVCVQNATTECARFRIVQVVGAVMMVCLVGRDERQVKERCINL